MKNIYPILAAIFILGIAQFSCKNLNDMNIDTSKDQVKPIEETDQIVFVKSWNRWDRQDFRLYDYFLKETTLINTVPCKGRFTVDSSGNLYGFTLGKDHFIRGSKIPAGSRYESRLNRESNYAGYMIYLSKPCKIQEYDVLDKAGMEDYKVTFYNDGALSAFKTPKNIKIDGILCKGGTKGSDINLYPNGKLFMCHVPNDIEINNVKYKADSRIILDQNGNVFKFTNDKYFELDKLIDKPAYTGF